MKEMRRAIKISLLSIWALTLSGCDPDTYVSQMPVMDQFIGKAPEQIYRQTEDAFHDGKYNTAISGCRAFITLYSDHKHIELAHKLLVDCYAARGQFEDAIKAIDKFISLYSESTHCATLKERKIELQHKQKRDRLYHLIWSKDVKKKHGAHYHGLMKSIDLTSQGKEE
jgi:tetratricopeptide (TPR) repeat protein